MLVSYILLVFWTFLVLFPIYWLLVTAFKLPIDVNTGPKYLMYVDFQPSTHAWKEMFVDSGDLVTRPYKNTADRRVGKRGAGARAGRGGVLCPYPLHLSTRSQG